MSRDAAERNSGSFFILLASADLVFIFLGAVHSFTGFGTAQFSLGSDFGHAEIYQYVKLFWIGGLLSGVWIRTHNPVYLAWAILFFFLLADDSLQIHERLGRIISAHLELAPMLGLRAQDFGELLASAVAGSLLLGLVGATFLLSDSSGKRFSIRLAISFSVLVFFGVGVDLVHSASSFMRKPLGVIEDGGEMLVISMICWRIYGTYTQLESRGVIEPDSNWKSLDKRVLVPRDRESNGAPVGS